MATNLHIDGPCQIKYDGVVLGITDNDDLPSVQFNQLQKEIKSVSGGDSPTAIIATGMTVSLSFTLVSWNDAVLNNLITQIGATEIVAGNISPNIGQVIAGHEMQIRTTNTPIKIFSFPNVKFRPDSFSMSRFGNVERRLTIHGTAYTDEFGILCFVSELP